MGAQIDIKANDNRTPFLMAVAAGSVESAQLFRESGADVQACTSDMKNCLHLAVDNGHLEMLQLLLEREKVSENLYKSDARERVPLHNAAISPNIKVPINNFFFFSLSRSFIDSFTSLQVLRHKTPDKAVGFRVVSRVIVFLGNTLNFHRASFHPSRQLGADEFNAGGIMRWTSIPYGGGESRKNSQSLSAMELRDKYRPDGRSRSSSHFVFKITTLLF